MPIAPPSLLVVEDDEALLSSLTWALEMEGFAVRAFCDAESLLAEETAPGDGCLILDYRLPAMNGLELLRRLRGRGVGLPAILITTPDPGVIRAAAAAGAHLVEKPLIAGQLLARVRYLTAWP